MRFGPTPLLALEDSRLNSDFHQIRLREMAQEAGWAERGGCIIRAFDVRTGQADGEVIARTKWVPFAPWFTHAQREARLSPNQDGRATRDAVDKALAGETMTLAERRHVQWMLDEIDRDVDDVNDVIDITDWGEDDAPDPETIMMVSRAAALDPEGVERLAVTFEDDDEQFLAHVRELLGSATACSENEAAVAGRTGTAAAKAAQASAAAGSRSSMRPRF